MTDLFPSICMNYFQGNAQKCNVIKSDKKNNTWISPLIWIRTRMYWVLHSPHPSTKFHRIAPDVFCVILLTNKQTNIQNNQQTNGGGWKHNLLGGSLWLLWAVNIQGSSNWIRLCVFSVGWRCWALVMSGEGVSVALCRTHNDPFTPPADRHTRLKSVTWPASQERKDIFSCKMGLDGPLIDAAEG